MRSFRGAWAAYMSGFQPFRFVFIVTWGCAPGWYMSGLRPFLAASFRSLVLCPVDIGILMRSVGRLCILASAYKDPFHEIFGKSDSSGCGAVWCGVCADRRACKASE